MVGGIQSGKVRFVVVAGPDAASITTLAQSLAATDPVRRKVVTPGSADYPSAIVTAAIAGIANPGALVLRDDDSVYTVLSVSDAQNGLIVDDAFSRAAA